MIGGDDLAARVEIALLAQQPLNRVSCYMGFAWPFLEDHARSFLIGCQRRADLGEAPYSATHPDIIQVP